MKISSISGNYIDNKQDSILSCRTMILYHISGKINMRTDILSRKNQVNTKEDNKDIKMLKDKIWKRRQTTEVEIVIFEGNKVVEETTLLEEIQKNNTRK